MTASPPPWKPLGTPAPASLAAARLNLHWALQAVAAVGHSLIEPTPDWSHSSLDWVESAGALAGQPLIGGKPCRPAIRLENLTLLVLDTGGAAAAEWPAAGHTLAEAVNWIGEAIAQVSGLPARTPELPGFEMPAHPAGEGGVIEPPDGAALSELGRWFADADTMLRRIAAGIDGAEPVRVWPHHCDIASLIALDPGLPAEEARTIGFGMTPGDGSYPEPYWYVTPWPYPEHPDLPELAGGGAWHREGWMGAVLTGTRLVAADASSQAGQVFTFLESAIGACRNMLNPAG